MLGEKDSSHNEILFWSILQLGWENLWDRQQFKVYC